MKRILVKLLAVLLVISVVNFGVVESAEANPFVVAAPLLVPAATVLVAAGVTIGSVAAIKELTQWWWSDAGASVRQALVDDFNSASQGVMTVSQEVWESVRAWVQERFDPGDNSVEIPIARQGWPPTVVYDANGVVLGGREYSASLEDNVVRLYRDGELLFVDFLMGNYTFELVGIFVNTNDAISIAYTWNGNLSAVMTTVFVSSVVCSVTGADVLSNPSWDWDGRRVLVPPTVDELVDKTYDDVIVTGGSGSGSGTRTLTDIFDAIMALPQAIANVFDMLLSREPLDLSPIRALSVDVTNKFPFSLPWDFRRVVEVLYAEPRTPRFVLQLPYPLSDVDVNLAVFDSIMPLIREIELLAFIAVLIYMTPRLLGGGR